MNGRAVVIGGGVGGLAAALALRQTGWSVSVHERSPGIGEPAVRASQCMELARSIVVGLT